MTNAPDNTSALLVRSPLNHDWGSRWARPLDPEWVRRRILIYLRHTIASLLRQTDRDFTIWLDCREGSEAVLEPFTDALAEAGVVVTFDRGKRLLEELPPQCEHVYVTRIDSDDLYAPDAIELIRARQGDRRASQFFRGYVCDARTGSIVRVAFRSPPFFTIRFRRTEITSAHALWELFEPIGHGAVFARLRPVELPHARFCMLRHGNNTAPNNAGRAIESPAGRQRIRDLFDLDGRFWDHWRGSHSPKLLHYRVP